MCEVTYFLDSKITLKNKQMLKNGYTSANEECHRMLD